MSRSGDGKITLPRALPDDKKKKKKIIYKKTT